VQGTFFNVYLDVGLHVPTSLSGARRQQAKSWELRAVMTLWRLWQGQGKREDARQLLAEVYGWFTEGFQAANSGILLGKPGNL
jgi:predicted ATPase